MTHEEQLKNKNHKQWIRGCLGFKYLSEGLVHTVDVIVKAQHESYTNPLAKSTCDKCSINTLLPNHAKVDNKCTKGRKKCFCLMYSRSRPRTSCPNFFCSAVYDNIVDDHRFLDPNWSNTDITKWGSSYAEVAKCFISSTGYKDKLRLEEIDCSGLINIVINHTAFERALTKRTVSSDPLSVFIKARDDRNALFHSPDMELTNDQLKDMVDNMIVLLQLPGIQEIDGKTQHAVEKLHKIRDDELYISVRDEIAIQKETLQALEIKRKEALDEIDRSKQDMLDKIEDLNENCETQVKDLSDKQQKTDTNIKKIESELKSSCKNLEGICNNLENRQNKIESALSKLQMAVKELNKKQDGYNLKQETLEKRIVDFSKEIPNLISKHLHTKSINERTDTALADLSLKRKKQLEYLKRKNDLQCKLCGYYRKCLSTIPVSPVLKTISGTVDEVFVELSICKDLTNKQAPEEEEQVADYKDMLYKDDTLCKSVYLLGEAGMGKTTWCKKVLNTWVSIYDETEVNVDSKGDDANKDTQKAGEDRQCLKQFDLLFYIALRQESEKVDVTAMLKHHPVVKEYSLQGIVDEVLKCEPQTCLILLDGLDEWTPQSDAETPSRDGLYGCPVVTTSRPYRLVGIHDVDDTFYADRIVKMTGIQNKELLVKKVMKQLSYTMKTRLSATEHLEASEKEYEQFLKDVKEMKDREMSYRQVLPGYMNIPLMLIIMVCLWFEKGKFENTITKNIAGMIEFIICYAEGFQSFRKKKVTTGKLEGIENLRELKAQWSKFAEKLPLALKNRTTLRSYSGLILKVAHFAFTSLFNSNHKISLTFSQEDLLDFFSEDELLVIVKIGILSQSEVTESSLCTMTKLSFIHKLFHEYLAGIFITTQYNSGKVETISIMKDYFKDPIVYNLQDIDNAPCFVGGIDPKASSKMSEHVFKELTLDVNKTNKEYLNTFYLRQVQVVHENDENFPSEEYPIYTEYIYVPDKLPKGKMKYLHLLLNTNMKHLKCIEMPCDKALEILEKVEDDDIPKDLKLCIYGIIPSSHHETLASSLFFVKKLQQLELCGTCKEYTETCATDKLNLTACYSLKELTLKELSNVSIMAKYNIPIVETDDLTKYKMIIST